MNQIETFQVNIKHLNRPRTVRVYLPNDYHESSNHYDVLYMHDGHNLFTKETSAYQQIWDVHTSLNQIEAHYDKNVIVVGIDCDPVHRLSEYSPWKMQSSLFSKAFIDREIPGGEGDLYLQWLALDLVSQINTRYRTTNINYMAGSSMGGFLSLYAGIKYPHIFSKVGCFSSAFWFARKKLHGFVHNNPEPNLGVYLDVGTKETKNCLKNRLYLSDTKKIYRLLTKQNYKNLKIIIEKGANHSETSWARRFPIFIEWLLEL